MIGSLINPTIIRVITDHPAVICAVSNEQLSLGSQSHLFPKIDILGTLVFGSSQRANRAEGAIRSVH